LLRKVCSVPDKIYRTNYKESKWFCGSHYESNRKQITGKLARWFGKPTNQSRDPTLTHLENKPLTDVELLSQNYVKIDGEFICAIDSDFVFDIAQNCQVKNGKLSGEYIFCLVSGETRLTRVGSPFYNQVLESDKRRKAPKIGKRNFDVGGIYATPGDTRAIYLGTVDTYEHSSKKPVKNLMLFYKFYGNQKPEFSIDKIDSPYYFALRKTSNFTAKVGQLDMDKSTVVQDIRVRLTKTAKQQLVERCSESSGYNSSNWYNYFLSQYTSLINMVTSGQPLSPILNLEKYLTYA